MNTEREYWYLRQYGTDFVCLPNRESVTGINNMVACNRFYKSKAEAISHNEAYCNGSAEPVRIGRVKWRQLRKEYLQKERTRLKTELKAVERELNSIAYKKMVERSNAANDETID